MGSLRMRIAKACACLALLLMPAAYAQNLVPVPPLSGRVIDQTNTLSAAQAQAIIDALRVAAAMRIESRDAAGVRFTDPYLLDGAPTAIDAAAARCALRGAGKIQ